MFYSAGGTRPSPWLRRYRSRRSWALTFLVMSSLRVNFEGKTTSKKTVFLFLCSFFLTTFEFTDRLREKKRGELNQTALSVDIILLRESGMPRAGGRHQLPVFSPGLSHKLLAGDRRRSVPGMFTAFVRVISTFRPISLCNQV